MTVKELYNILEDSFPSSLRAEWDNDGLVYCFDGKRQVKRVLITLDVTLKSIEYAVENGFDTIISHHPLIFKPISALDFSGVVGERLKKIIKNDLNVMSFHTRLDCVLVNDALAEELALTDVQPFLLDGLPMGRIGESKAMPVSCFAEFVKEKLGAGDVESPFVFKGTVQKVAVLGGGGADAVSVAMKLGADALVTGECSYNKMIDAAEMGLAVITAGHFYTENPVCKRLKELIQKIDTEINCEIYNSNIIDNI